MRVRILYMNDDSVSVVYPVLKSRRGDETEERWLRRVFDKATPPGSDYDDIDTDQTPLPDKRFRNAWAKGDAGIKIDIVRAKGQIMAELREVRDGELARTDGLMARANEIGSQVEINRLTACRRKLRDLPQMIIFEDVKTVEELSATYPGRLSVEEYLDLAIA